MRKILLAALLLSVSHPALADGPYKILRTVTVGGEGGFDYIVADSDGRRLYIARSGKTNPRLVAYDLDTLKQAGELDGISAHGAVVDPSNHHGFSSSKPVTMFDSTTTSTLKSITVDGNPDGLSLLKRLVVMHHRRRRGEDRAQNGAPFLESLAFAEAHGVVFQRFPPYQQQEIFRVLDALAHLAFVKAFRTRDVRAGFGKGGLEGGGLAGFHGDEGAFEDHNALRILAAMGSSFAASTMTLPCGANPAPSQRGTIWKWT